MGGLEPGNRSLVLLGFTLLALAGLVYAYAPRTAEGPAPATVSVLIIAPDRLPLFNGTIELSEGNTTALDALLGAAERANLSVEVTDQFGAPFVTRIGDYRNEGASGWCYHVNDEWIGRSAGQFDLDDGDRVRWFWAPGGCDA